MNLRVPCKRQEISWPAELLVTSQEGLRSEVLKAVLMWVFLFWVATTYGHQTWGWRHETYMSTNKSTRPCNPEDQHWLLKNDFSPWIQSYTNCITHRKLPVLKVWSSVSRSVPRRMQDGQQGLHCTLPVLCREWLRSRVPRFYSATVCWFKAAALQRPRHVP
jgi:hypothetical protein